MSTNKNNINTCPISLPRWLPKSLGVAADRWRTVEVEQRPGINGGRTCCRLNGAVSGAEFSFLLSFAASEKVLRIVMGLVQREVFVSRPHSAFAVGFGKLDTVTATDLGLDFRRWMM